MTPRLTTSIPDPKFSALGKAGAEKKKAIKAAMDPAQANALAYSRKANDNRASTVGPIPNPLSSARNGVRAASVAGTSARPIGLSVVPASDPVVPAGMSAMLAGNQPTQTAEAIMLATNPTATKAVATTEATTDLQPMEVDQPEGTKKRKVTERETITVHDSDVEVVGYADFSEHTQERVYQHPDGTVKLSFGFKPPGDKTAVADARGDEFLRRANYTKQKIDSMVFNSPIDPELLMSLDLRSAANIMPMLVNQEGELRTRAEKSSKKKPNIIAELREKGEVFLRISQAAQRQASAYLNRAQQIEQGQPKKSKGKDADLDQMPANLENLILTDPNAPMGAADAQKFARGFLTYVVSLAERFRQELLPVAAYIRKHSAMVAEKEDRLLQLSTYLTKAMKQENPQRFFFPRMMEIVDPDLHLCECPKCPVEHDTAIEESEPMPAWRVPEYLREGLTDACATHIENYFNPALRGPDHQIPGLLRDMEDFSQTTRWLMDEEQRAEAVRTQEVREGAEATKAAEKLATEAATKQDSQAKDAAIRATVDPMTVDNGPMVAVDGATFQEEEAPEGVDLMTWRAGQNSIKPLTKANNVLRLWKWPAAAIILNAIGPCHVAHWDEWRRVRQPLMDNKTFYKDQSHINRMTRWKLINDGHLPPPKVPKEAMDWVNEATADPMSLLSMPKGSLSLEPGNPPPHPDNQANFSTYDGIGPFYTTPE
ncbi:MAG: hypothetical protein Q9207_002027 [Kuettlingeria erythrocarpa]